MKKLLAALCALTLVLSACDVGDMVLEPGTGVINDGPTVPVSGQLPSWVSLGGTLVVNGQPTPVNPDKTWATTVPSEPGRTTDIEAVYTHPRLPDVVRERTVVLNGPSLAEGEMSPDGVGMRFTNEGLAGLGPVIQDLAGSAFDIGGLLLSQNPIISQEDAFLGLDVVGNAFEAGIGGVSLDAASTTSGVATHITIDDLFVGVNLHISGGLINLNCGLELQIPTTAIDATFDLEPQVGSPSNVDVNLVGTPVVDTGNVTYEFISGVCDSDVFIIGDIVNAVAGPQIQALVGEGFETSLGDPDGAGPLDSPIADAIETALAGISVAGPVGEAIGAQLDAPFTQITEGADAIDLRADADFATSIGTGAGQCQPPAGAPDLPSTFDVPGAYPALGATTPSGDPYGLGLVISASAFNQMLGSMTECGLVNKEIHEISLGGPPVPITSTVLSALVPELATELPPGSPMYIRVTPSFAPLLTEDAGPSGEPAELYLANLKIELMQHTPQIDLIWLSLGVDAPLGFDLAFDPLAGELAPTITPPPASQVSARVLGNFVGTNEPVIQALFPALFPIFAGDLSSSFGNFPLPDFLGLDLEVLEVQRIGNHFVLYSNLNPIPQTRIENVQITDLSSGDSVTDSVLDANEWRHRIRPQISSTGVNVAFKGMIGADACCFTGDEERTATAAYRIGLGVVPEGGDTWRLDLSQLLQGAHTIHNEDQGRGSTAFTTAITGRARIGAGAWQDFSFTPSANVASTGNGSGGTANVAFSGSNALVLQGTTAEQVTLEFGFGVSARSDSDVFPPRAGDEAAIRFGANDTITNGFTAGEYPGAGGRNIVTDGHFATIALSTVG